MDESRIQTLQYDSTCCHIQGDCEWVACEDSVAVQLAGGTLRSPAVGVYVGASSSIAVPEVFFANENTTVVLFQAVHITDSVTIAVGRKDGVHLRVVPVSPTGTHFNLTGPFWKLVEQNVHLMITNEQTGRLLSEQTLFTSVQTGQRSYAGTVVGSTDGFQPQVFTFKKLGGNQQQATA
jgi:hypothetical protein